MIFDRLESEVRGYCRSFPAVFETASGARMVDERGRSYVDFFAGAGALNYGHDEPAFRSALIEYLASGGVVHTLDLHTKAKARLLEALEERVLAPRGMRDWKVMFPGPTGTNAVEAALKLARKVTGRARVVSFTNGFHGMTLGSLAVTGNAGKRAGAGIPLAHATALPYCGYQDDLDSLNFLEHMLVDQSSGLDKPAAVILETVQAEGGVNVASVPWLKRLRELTREHDVLLIADDIQVGCGRTGPFFSFERAGITPDIVTLSKSLSGYGLPFALTLFRRDLDVWAPGEHNGTFRGFNLAMVTATKALELYWSDDALTRDVERRAGIIDRRLEAIARKHPRHVVETRGLGMIRGIECKAPKLASAVSKAAFERGLIIETAGARDEVVKTLPPLVIDDATLSEGLDILARAFDIAVDRLEPEDDEVSAMTTGGAVIHAGSDESY